MSPRTVLVVAATACAIALVHCRGFVTATASAGSSDDAAGDAGTTAASGSPDAANTAPSGSADVGSTATSGSGDAACPYGCSLLTLGTADGSYEGPAVVERSAPDVLTLAFWTAGSASDGGRASADSGAPPGALPVHMDLLATGGLPSLPPGAKVWLSKTPAGETSCFEGPCPGTTYEVRDREDGTLLFSNASCGPAKLTDLDAAVAGLEVGPVPVCARGTVDFKGAAFTLYDSIPSEAFEGPVVYKSYSSDCGCEHFLFGTTEPDNIAPPYKTLDICVDPGLLKKPNVGDTLWASIPGDPVGGALLSAKGGKVLLATVAVESAAFPSAWFEQNLGARVDYQQGCAYATTNSGVPSPTTVWLAQFAVEVTPPVLVGTDEHTVAMIGGFPYDVWATGYYGWWNYLASFTLSAQ